MSVKFDNSRPMFYLQHVDVLWFDITIANPSGWSMIVLKHFTNDTYFFIESSAGNGFIFLIVPRASCQLRKLRATHAPRMPGTFSLPPRVSNPDMHHGTCVTHVPWCMPGSLTSGYHWSRWRGKRSRHSRCMGNRQFYMFGKRRLLRYSSAMRVFL